MNLPSNLIQLNFNDLLDTFLNSKFCSYLEQSTLQTLTQGLYSLLKHTFSCEYLGLVSDDILDRRIQANFAKEAPDSRNWHRNTKQPIYVIDPVILFGILGSYLFLHIWENILLKLGKLVLKIHEIGKIKAILGFGMTPI